MVAGAILVRMITPALGHSNAPSVGVTLKPPYGGTTILASSGGHHGCNWHTTISQAPVFSKSTGIGRAAANSSAVARGGAANFSSGGASL
ncbi:MAG: hypothetical protein L3K15_06895 [Thermoplasmata archaeon]|nr:hypothetical protein [Thermoplasmata archaeon]